MKIFLNYIQTENKKEPMLKYYINLDKSIENNSIKNYKKSIKKSLQLLNHYNKMYLIMSKINS
jgi:hypothetical protein